MLYLDRANNKIDGRMEAMRDGPEVYTYGCMLCNWEGTATSDEDAAYAESMAHGRTKEHRKNASMQMPKGLREMHFNERGRHNERLSKLLSAPPEPEPSDDPDAPTYTARRLTAGWITELERHEHGVTVTTSEGWTTGVSHEVAAGMAVGKPVLMEAVGLSRCTGWVVDGAWVGRKSDQDLAREAAEHRLKRETEKRTRLEACRADWQAREAALPDWIRARLGRFHRDGGENFEVDGWGYELIIAELAVLYADLGDDLKAENGHYPMPPTVRDYADREGSSGNQNDVAFQLAKAHLAEPTLSMDGTIAALTPLGAHPFYASKDGE